MDLTRLHSLGLPALGIAEEVNAALSGMNALVVTAPPGAGKSTVLPLAILQALDGGGKVLMLEPRRIAARQVAERMAWLLGEKVGGTVGYRVRFESRVSAQTRVEVITEGILSRMMLDDPSLEGVQVLVFDEFHERSLESDEALALARRTQDILRPDLKLVIMSATIDTDSICKAMDTPLVHCEGRTFPIDTRYSDKDTDPRSCAEDVARAVLRAHRQSDGDILAFLPGEAEIRRCAELLEGELGTTAIHPLYGMLPFEEQNRAIAPSGPGHRKAVLATSIAETSLTIEGVRIVIDSGLCRTQVYDPQTGQSHLETVTISADMAAQRAGRAGRVAPGICWKLYREQTARSMKPVRTPAILDADLVPLQLDLAVWGESDLPWLTPPPQWKMSQARAVLEGLGAVDAGGRITATGRRLSAYPCHPRLAKMLDFAASDAGLAALAADLAAIIEDRDPMSGSGADIDLRVSALREARRRGTGDRRWVRTIRAAGQYRRLAKAAEDNSDASWDDEARLLCAAYPERIGRMGDDAICTLASGDRVQLEREDPLTTSDWIVAVSANVQPGMTGRVFLAARVHPDLIMPIARLTSKVVWDPRENAVVARQEWRVGGLLADSRPLPDVPREKMSEVLCEAARKYGTSMFDFSDAVQNLQRRVSAVASWHPELELPDLSTQAVLERAADWLPFYAGKATTATELKKLDLTEVLWGLLDYDRQRAVERLAPSHMEVPTGSRIRLEYRQGAQAPVLRVRLQECFGLTDTPRVDDGRLPVLMELLSPGYKPVQLTSDLASFWNGTYFEVRKELRRRYPKHSWPDNPLEADAVRGVRKK